MNYDKIMDDETIMSLIKLSLENYLSLDSGTVDTIYHMPIYTCARASFATTFPIAACRAVGFCLRFNLSY